MPKKSTLKNESVAGLEGILAEPKFDGLRELLLNCGKSFSRDSFLNIAEFFDVMPETQRAEFAPFCLAWYNFLKKSCSPTNYIGTLPEWYQEGSSKQNAYLAVKVAILASCSEKEIKRILQEANASFITKETESILRSRKPEWVADFLLWVPQETGMTDVQRYEYWRIYRRFFNEKIVPWSNSPFWIIHMFSCMIFDTSERRYCNEKGISLIDQLKNDPGLIESDIWELFERNDFPFGWNLTSIDSHFSSCRDQREGEDWKGTFCTLIEEEIIPKNRVVESCFRSLSRQFSDHEMKWFLGLLEQMIERKIVTENDLVEDSRFLDLLNYHNPSPRSLGLKILEQLFKAGKIADIDAINCVTGIFLDPQKGKAKKVLVLLDKIAKKNKELRPEVANALLEGLRHEETEIQQKSLELLLKYDCLAIPEIEMTVNEIAPYLAASTRIMLPGNSVTKKPATTESHVEVENTAAKTLNHKDYIRVFKNLADPKPPTSIAATDALIESTAAGNFDTKIAIEAAIEVIGFNVITISRWQKPFKTVAEQSGKHAIAVKELLEGIVPVLEKKTIAGFLEIMLEISHSQQLTIDSQSCRSFLQAIVGNSKAAKLAKKLLGL